MPTVPDRVNEKLDRDDAEPVSLRCRFSRMAVAKGRDTDDVIMIGAKHSANRAGARWPNRNSRQPNTRHEL